jgi:two-component system chemotaxis family response regulator WspR
MSTDHPKAHPPSVGPTHVPVRSTDPTARLRRAADAAEEMRFVDDSNCVVLLVDDQLMIGEAVRRALANEPTIVFHFCSEPGAAIKTAERIAPTVILQDLVMPGIEGLTLVREYRAREATRNTPIIVLSTREDPTTKKDALGVGANDYIVKLPDKIELIARIRYHSQAYLSRRQRDAAYAALHESQRQLMAANIELLRLSNMDGLTGLNNRRRFDEYASTEWRRVLRERAPFGLLLIDVDQFKPYNDANGHLAGDELLRRIGETILNCCRRPEDLPARYGGDEFAIVLPGIQANALEIIGERLRQAVQDLRIEHASSFTAPYVSLSVGGAVTVPTVEGGLLDLIAVADRNLYEAKTKGRNRCVVRSPRILTGR